MLIPEVEIMIPTLIEQGMDMSRYGLVVSKTMWEKYGRINEYKSPQLEKPIPIIVYDLEYEG